MPSASPDEPAEPPLRARDAASPPAARNARVLALDYGSARCGCAVSDPTRTIVTPIEPVLRPGTRRGLASIRELVTQRDAATVLIGLPLGLDGRDTDQTRETRRFAQRLADALGDSVRVELYDERFTTRLAQRLGRDSGAAARSEDSRAAAHLLESWLFAGAP